MSRPDEKRLPFDPGGVVKSPPGYKVKKALGRGSTGVVYLARDQHLPRWVALKMLEDGGNPDGRALTRFRSEAEAMARLHHPHIVQIHALGEQDGLPFIVMEYVPGVTLAHRMRSGTPCPPGDAARLVQVLAGAVHAAHRTGIVHRDLKPENILLAPPVAGGEGNTALGFPKIADFGLASPVIPDPDQAESGAIQGTPLYMAPEQAAGRPDWVSPATDVYALGVILYELLTGQVPFDSDNILDLLRSVREEEPDHPGSLNPDVPPGLAEVCLRCLSKTPASRYGSALELAEALAPFATPPEPAGENEKTATPPPLRRRAPDAATESAVPRMRKRWWADQPTWNLGPRWKGGKVACVAQPA